MTEAVEEASTDTLDRIERVYTILEEESLEGSPSSRGAQAWLLERVAVRKGREYSRTSMYRWVREEHPLPDEVAEVLEDLEDEAREKLRKRLGELG